MVPQTKSGPRWLERDETFALIREADAAIVTPHACRHWFGKNLVDAGEPLDRMAMLMGHKDLSTTAIYTTPSPADLARAVEKIAWRD